MNDQAATLRTMAASDYKPERPVRRLRCIAVGSGKGGVGKTVVSIGLACALARWRFNVLIIDADLGLANVDLQLGVDPAFTLQDVVFGHCPLEDAVISTPYGPDLLASASGAPEMVNMGGARREMLVNELIRFAGRYDYLIIDGAAGIGQSIVSFFAAAPEVIVVVANEPTSIMDAYSLIKVLRQSTQPPALRLVLNMVRTLEEGDQLAQRLNLITQKFLGLEIPVAGVIPYDQAVGNAIRARRPVFAHAPGSPPARCLEEIARFMATDTTLRKETAPDGRAFFARLAGISAGGPLE